MSDKRIEQDYLTIKEAAKLTGKSEITIRRLIKNEADLEGMQNTMLHTMQKSRLNSSLIKKEKTPRGFIYKVHKQFIIDRIKLSDNLSDKVNDKADDKVSNELMLTLKEQLQIKDRQIEDLSRKLDELIERDRETNIILKGLQDKLLLLENPNLRFVSAGIDTQESLTVKFNQEESIKSREIETLKKEIGILTKQLTNKGKQKNFLERLFGL